MVETSSGKKSAAGGIAAKPPSNSVSLAFFLW